MNNSERERDIQLLRRLALRDNDALAELYDCHSKLLFGVAYRIIGETKEAEDILQEAFVSIWERAADFDPRLGVPLSWMVTIARNRAIEHVRASERQKRLVQRASAETPSAPESNDQPADNEDFARARSIMSELPVDQRRAIEMAFLDGLTQTQIAERLQEPLGTIKARIRRGLMHVRGRLEGEL